MPLGPFNILDAAFQKLKTWACSKLVKSLRVVEAAASRKGATMRFPPRLHAGCPDGQHCGEVGHGLQG